MRLEPREKNALMEVERLEEAGMTLEQTEPPSCCSATARDPARYRYRPSHSLEPTLHCRAGRTLCLALSHPDLASFDFLSYGSLIAL